MTTSTINYQELAEKIKSWGQELGFSQIGFSDIDLSSHEKPLQRWLDNNYHGDMDYMEKHGLMRARANELVPDTIRVISARMDYLPSKAKFAQTLKDKNKAYVSRYALGRDYHKLMRKKLKQLGQRIQGYCQQFNYRPFVDSAPILERPLAAKAGLGWVGKHTLLINQDAGSWFFLGELLVDIPLPVNNPISNQCGSCVSCIKICPTQAIIAPYVVDARRCISYLTIELRDSIPVEFRPLIGNRIYGCDDCQLICPWNQYGQLTAQQDFEARQRLDDIYLLAVFAWSEAEFLSKTEGSPIRRIGFACWQRNIAVALGNADFSETIVTALKNQLPHASTMVAEHITWALEQQMFKQQQAEQLIAVTTSNQRLSGRLIRSIEKGLPRDA